MKRRILGVCWLVTCGSLLACHAGPEESVDAAAAAQPRADASVDAGPAPADVDTIRALLRARHADDLPSAEQLARYPSAEASLRHLAEHGETMVIRVRALALLEHFGSDATGELLLRVVADAQLHPALRAAALTGMAGQPLDDQPERQLAVIASLADPDPRVGIAAVELLARSATGRELLDQAAQRDDLPKAVRERLDGR
jgi:hypothetical protein